MTTPGQSFPPPPGGGQGPGMPGMQGRPGMPGAPGAPAGKAGKAGKDKSDKPVTKRLVSTQRAAALGLAVLAFLAAIVLSGGDKAETVFVVRTSEAVPAMMEVSVDRLEAIAIDPLYLEEGAVVGDSAEEALTEAAELVDGARTQVPLAKGAQVRPDMFSTEASLAGRPLEADERLVSIRANVTSAVAGSLRAGDHVDVIAFYEGDPGLAGLVGSNIEIVAVSVAENQLSSAASAQSGEEGRELKPSDVLPTTPIPGTYTMRVKADQAVRFAALDAATQLYLTYRGADATDVVTPPVEVLALICAGPGNYYSEAPLTPAAEIPAACSPAPVVEGDPLEGDSQDS